MRCTSCRRLVIHGLFLRVPRSEIDIEAQPTIGSNRVFDGEYVSASSFGGRLIVTFAAQAFDGPVLSKRLNHATRYFKRAMLKAGADPATAERTCAEFDVKVDDELDRLLTRIDKRLEEIAGAPVPPRIVEGCLGITSGERNRWMKDGRLPACQAHRSNRTQATFTIHYFPAGLVNELARRPDIIGQWREQDRLGHE
jgi:hypothetical protein